MAAKVKVKVAKAVAFAHDGHRVVHYAVGVQEVPADFAGWLEENGEYGEVVKAKAKADDNAGEGGDGGKKK